MKLSKNLGALFTFMFVFYLNWGYAQSCPFTEEQGLAVGCALAQDANANGCYRQSCWNAYINTIRDFEQNCPEYTLGVIEGFLICNRPPRWQNNANSDPLDDNGNINDPGCENFVYINGHWECP